MNRRVKDFYGRPVKISCGEGGERKEIVERQIEPFAKEIEQAWLCGGQAEEHVKGYLSYVGSLIIRKPDKDNVLSYKKEKRIANAEVLVADVSKAASKTPDKVGRLPAGERRRPKTYGSTRFQRMEAIKQEHPGCKIAVVRVDTDGRFGHQGQWFRLLDGATGYAPRQTGQGLYYPMDQVYVVDAVGSGDALFYDQALYPIDGAHVVCEGPAL